MSTRSNSFILHSSSIRLRSIAAATLLGLSAAASASVTINFAFGELRDSSATVLTDGIWAIVVGSGTALPGGLSNGTSLDSADASSAWSAFSGKDITAGTSIGGFTIAATGDNLASSGVDGVILESYEGTHTAGQSWGLYWFPTLTLSNSTLGSGTFEVGGFFETAPSPESGGDAGMVIPADSTNVTAQYLESNVAAGFELGPTTFTPARFTAIATTPTFHWDTDGVTAGAQGGTGAWNTTSATNWNAGASNYVWAATGANNAAVFGGTAGTVTISTGVAANNLTFNTTGYTITGGTLTLNGTTPTVTTATGVTATISSAVAGTAGLTKAGAGTLVLSATSSYTGATLINEGKLEMGDAAADTFATNSVTVASGATLSGSGTIAGTLAISGILAPGNDGIGTLTAGTTTWNGGASDIWEFSLGTPSLSDKLVINGNFTRGTGSTFQFDFMNSVPASGTYTLVDWSGSTDFLFSNFSYTGLSGAYAGSFFTINGSQLDFTAVPEPTSALAGLLITAGLLRRRRA